MRGDQTIGVERESAAGKPPRTSDSATPAGHALNIRDQKFCRGERPARWWHSGDPVATAWYNSVSASLPRGEKFFIQVMKYYDDKVPPSMAKELRAFTRQESNHAREHVAFNNLAQSHGYDIESIDKGIEEMLALTKGRPVEFNLAITIALEHFAASISHCLLTDPRYLDGVDEEIAEMWRWHSIEEIEHKGITYDVWLHATREWSTWKRYRVRALLTLLITRRYYKNRVRDALGLLRQDGIAGARAKWLLFKHLWIAPGMMRRMFFDWAKILLPGFHPWKQDDRALIRKFDSPYADAVMPAE